MNKVTATAIKKVAKTDTIRKIVLLNLFNGLFLIRDLSATYTIF